MRELLQGVLAVGYPVFCSYPNADPGNMGIRKVIDDYRTSHENLIAYHNLPRGEFISLYRHAIAIVGNSSSIVTESGYLKVPGVLVGRRQELRETNPNVLRVGAEASDIKQACLKCLHDEEFLSTVNMGVSLYGDGGAASKIAGFIRESSFQPGDLLKTIVY